jgi:hypothetical protein
MLQDKSTETPDFNGGSSRKHIVCRHGSGEVVSSLRTSKRFPPSFNSKKTLSSISNILKFPDCNILGWVGPRKVSEFCLSKRKYKTYHCHSKVSQFPPSMIPSRMNLRSRDPIEKLRCNLPRLPRPQIYTRAHKVVETTQCALMGEDEMNQS